MTRIIILLSFSAIFAFSACKNEEHKKEEAHTKFLVSSPKQIDTIVYKNYVCQINAFSHIELRSQEKGYLQNIYVDEGQFVKKGQLMFRIMPIIYQAEKLRAQANVNFAEIEYQTTKNLADSNIVSKNELLLAKAKLDKEQAELSLADAHLSFTEIRAPFDGLMDRFSERLGSLIEEGALLTTLSDNSKMWVYFYVPEAEYLNYISDAKKEERKKVQLEMANHELFSQIGIVETIEADFNSETGNIAFRATFPNPQRILRHGETGNIQMPIVLKQAILIPQKATFDILDKKYVYVVDEHNTLKSREITVIHEMPHMYVVSAGLQANDKFLLEGLGKVKNDEKIEYDFVPYEKAVSDLKNLHAE